ncbi:MAG: response regulator [Fimbriimonas sp.]|nr:response regulator [Fimbriimonas sp.]
MIDDEPNIRTMIKLVLEHAGYEVDVAADGMQGLAKFGNGADWDLVLLDQRMPGMAGIDVQRQILSRRNDTRLILITAFGTIDLALEAIQAGASDFLRKPFTAEMLRSTVSTVLDRPVQRMTAVPVGMVCREFTRTTINGFSFDLDHQAVDENTDDMTCVFNVNHAGAASRKVKVELPAYVMELVRAYVDSDNVPGGGRFWQAMCEEALANYLWQNAEAPSDNVVRIEDLSSTLTRWLDSVLTISLAEDNAR